ncbi:MAG: ThuA domain-containing protein [Planctomycetota bacterium]
MKSLLLFVALFWSTTTIADDQSWITLQPENSNGKHIVFVTGDEEYRSEQGMPQIAKILAEHHNFHCTVLFSIDPESGEINPQINDNIPGLEALDDADLLVLFTRFRNLPDEQMEHIVRFIEAGKPVIGLRTSTHAFDIPGDRKYHRWSWRNGQWNGGFGRQIMGETWVDHHGGHGWQSSSGIVAEGASKHPIMAGIKDADVWDPSDVYTVRLPLPESCNVLLLGKVLSGMDPADGPCDVEQRDDKPYDKNNPMMPAAWTNVRISKDGKSQRIFSTTFGASRSFLREGSRRMMVNACYWCLNMEEQISPTSKVDIVGDYTPTRFGFGKHLEDVRPADLVKKAQ